MSLRQFLRTKFGRSLFPLAAIVDDALRTPPPICADTGAPKHPGNCWNVRCQLGGTCCRASTPADPCPHCERGGVCKTPECGRIRSSELMHLYGTPRAATPTKESGNA